MSADFNLDSVEFRHCGPVAGKIADDAYSINNNLIEDYITNYEIDILILLAIEAFSKDSQIAEVSFQGIKNKLNLHQQKISTAIKRLMDKKLVKKTLNGYTLEKKGMEIVDEILKKNCIKNNGEDYLGLEICVPINNKNSNLFKLIYLLKGRWFSHWRWVAIFSNPESVKMEWQSLKDDEDLEACLCITEKRLRVAIFDKSCSPNRSDLAFLEDEFNEFLSKIQDIMGIDFLNKYSVSRYKILTHASCDIQKMRNWLSNYA
jgi:hypothetical protein